MLLMLANDWLTTQRLLLVLNETLVDELQFCAHKLKVLDELLLENLFVLQRFAFVAQVISDKVADEWQTAHLFRVVFHHKPVALDEISDVFRSMLVRFEVDDISEWIDERKD